MGNLKKVIISKQKFAKEQEVTLEIPFINNKSNTPENMLRNNIDTALSSNKTSNNEPQYKLTKNSIVVMDRTAYSRNNINKSNPEKECLQERNSENVKKATAKKFDATMSSNKPPNNGVDKSAARAIDRADSYNNIIKKSNPKEVHLAKKVFDTEKEINSKIIPVNDNPLNAKIRKTTSKNIDEDLSCPETSYNGPQDKLLKETSNADFEYTIAKNFAPGKGTRATDTVALNQLPDLSISTSDHECVISNACSSDDDTVKSRLKELYRQSKLHIVKNENKKEGGDQTILDIKNLSVTLSSNILEKENNATEIIKMKDNSRSSNNNKIASTVVLNKIANKDSLTVQSSNLEEFHHKSQYLNNIRNESGNQKKEKDELKELYKTAQQHNVHNSKSNNNTETRGKDSKSYVLKVPKKSKEPLLRLPFEKVDNHKEIDQQNKRRIALNAKRIEVDILRSKIKQEKKVPKKKQKMIHLLKKNQKESLTAR